jgi:sucrose phosphorylase
VRPDNTVTVLDTHDGISIPDVGYDVTDPDRPGLLDDPAIDALVERIHANTNGESRMATGTAASNIDVHQVNSTYYDALARDDDASLLARAVQLFTPGVPQVYYVGLLAGTNDMDLLERTGVGRDINRHRYLPGELERAVERPVVRRLMSLIRFRNRYPAFAGSCRIDHAGDSDLTIRWEAGAHVAMLAADFADRTVAITIDEDGAQRTVQDLAELPEALGPGSQ